MSVIRVYPDPVSLAYAAAEQIAEIASRAIASRGRFSMALSGGSTPRGVYERLGMPDLSSRIDWTRTHVFWCDERCVPSDHVDNNYRMTRETLLGKLTIPTRNIHRIRTRLEPAQAAAEYERFLRVFFSTRGHDPTFDLVLLGMGDDGHTASLFPHSSALRETARWVLAVEHNSPPPPLVTRVTLTPQVINRAVKVIFIVTGEAKAERLREVMSEPHQPDALPAQMIRPTSGDLVWLLDEAAAAKL